MPRSLCCPRCTPATRDGAYRAADVSARARVELRDEVWEASIVVQRCAECDGVWLREGQLDEIRHTRDNDYGEHDQMRASDQRVRRGVRAQKQQPAEELACPVCDEPLVCGEHRRSKVDIASCMSCAGTWVDADGLRQIEIYTETLIN